ncbi:unnamed protein product [Brachionus calyciflorus]|uniref:PHD-type domain-containing protein n=1 Tax=Brachionus calyciflorus TaxID=104777 RepID=A0A814GU56_9BILA|nr:unnamed protein product [Brachionus calyciflorus]
MILSKNFDDLLASCHENSRSKNKMPGTVPALIQYLGNDEIATPKPHGNSKNANIPFTQFLSSTLKLIKQNCEKNEPNVVYKQAHPSSKPRNLKQCQNIKTFINRQKRFSSDELINMHILHLSIGFVKQILTIPDVRIIALDDKLLKETKKIFQILPKNKKVFFSYDTTFNICGYYVSVLVYKHPLIEKSDRVSPPVPFSFFFHERKTEETHLDFMQYIKRILPEIEEFGFIVTDDVAAIRNSILKTFPSISVLRDVGYYIDSVRELFLQTSIENYNRLRTKLFEGYTDEFNNQVPPWDELFKDYFIRNIEIDKYFLAACYINPVCEEAFNNWTRITTNVAEGLNNLYKKFLVHKDLPLDTTAIAFYKLSIYYCNEIQLAFCTQGNYTLKSAYNSLQMDKNFINLRDTQSPDKILDEVLASNELLTSHSSSSSDEIDSNRQILVSTSNSQESTSNESNSEEILEPTPRVLSFFNSKLSRAIWLFNNDRISHNIRLGIYNVLDETNSVFQISLHPCPKCNCIEGTGCAHILAVQKSNGKNIENEYRRPNLSNLIVGVCEANVQTVVAETETVLASESENSESRSSQSKLDFNQFGEIINLILLGESRNLFKDLYSSKKKIDENMLIVDHNEIDDKICDYDFENYRKFFSEDGWVAFSETLRQKKISCTCPICVVVILSSTPSIGCDGCNKWYHFSCLNLDENDIKKKYWYCTNCHNSKKKEEKKPKN